MKVAIIGSRTINIDIDNYVPSECTEIITGGAKGVDQKAEEYAKKNKIKLTIIRPDYRRYRRGAPYRRNKIIVKTADIVIAIWDGQSLGTKSVIDFCKKIGRPCKVITL